MRIAFIGAMAGSPWGGSEELWSKAAKILAEDGHHVIASVVGWPQTPTQINDLRSSGIAIYERRPFLSSLLLKGLNKYFPKILVPQIDPSHWREVLQFMPDLVCISQGGNGCGIDWMQLCADVAIPYVTITQANSVQFWPYDHRYNQLKRGFCTSKRNFFVSKANKEMLERQIGCHLQNCEIVRNPFGVPYDISLQWPAYDDQWNLACVGRFDPQSKGQDILLEVLSMKPWKNRPIKVSLFGSGPATLSLKALIGYHNLHDVVEIKPYCNDVSSIWSTHHALVLPSRYEGLPLVVVEAMLCNRIAIVTDVAGNREVVEDEVTGFVADAATPKHFAKALERAWDRRNDWEYMGSNAGHAIRQLIPACPARFFANQLLETH
jgi:glycosyltransferase involved in cell wall biosynthesis